MYLWNVLRTGEKSNIVEVCKFHPYSILTGDTRVEFVIYSVLSIILGILHATTLYYLFSRNTDPIIDKITKNIGRLILLSLDLSLCLDLRSFNVNWIQSLNFWTLVNIPGFPFPYLLQSSLVLISDAIPTRTSGFPLTLQINGPPWSP